MCSLVVVLCLSLILSVVDWSTQMRESEREQEQLIHLVSYRMKEVMPHFCHFHDFSFVDHCFITVADWSILIVRIKK